MSVMLIPENAVIVSSVVPISKSRHGTVELKTMKKIQYADRLTFMLTSLPADVYSHSVRVSVTASILARQAKHLPERQNSGLCSRTIGQGALYHHIGAFIESNDKKRLPLLTETILKENLPKAAANGDGTASVNNEMILDIVRSCRERADGSGYPDGRFGQDVSLAARLVGFACELDSLLGYKDEYKKKSVDKADSHMREKGDMRFGADALACYEQVREMILGLYLNKRKRSRE